MALNVYSDAGTTTVALPNEVFTNLSTGVNYCDGNNKIFHLGFIPDVEKVASVYIEERATYNTVTFSAGVSSSLSGAAFTTNALVGQRVIHNGEFRGAIISNTSNTVTLDNSYTQATSSNCVISKFTKQRLTEQYSLSGVTVTFVTAPASTSYVHVLPITNTSLAFGGAAGDSVTKSSSVWLKREPGYEYRSIKVYSQDNSVTDNTFTQSGVTSTGTPGVMSGFSGLVTNQYAGYAVWHNNAFRGVVVSNTASTVTLDRAYTEAATYDAQLFNIGPMEVSLNGSTYDAVVSPSDITTDTAVRIYYRDTVKIPNAPANYPNVTIKVTGIEYITA